MDKIPEIDEKSGFKNVLLSAHRKLYADLDVRATIPYILTCGRASYSCIAHLPHFGSSKGMVIASITSKELQSPLEKCAKLKGLYCSFIGGMSDVLERKYVQGLLVQVGYFGPEDAKPSWYPNEEDREAFLRFQKDLFN